MARIYIESLEEEYRKKLCERKLTRETIDSLAGSISKKYLLQRRALKRVAVLLAVVTILMAAMSFFSPAARSGNMGAIVFSFAFVIVLEILILAGTYYVIVTRVPRQFSQCLQKGYPELMMEYGYEQILSGSLAERQGTRQLPLSLRIEDTFKLKNSEDIVVVGFVHGLIERGNPVMIVDRNDPSKEPAVAVVRAIEKADRKAVAQAADCNVALRIQKGAQLGLVPGMYLYRE